MDTATVFFAGMQAVFWVISLFFMPGFVITLVFFPRLMEIGITGRLVCSAILGTIFALVLVLFMGLVSGADPTPGNIDPAVAVFLALMLMIWLFELSSPGSRFREWTAPRLSRSRRYQTIRKNISRRLHAALDPGHAAAITVVYHESQGAGRNHISHSYLLNVGREIDIQQIAEYKGKNSGSALVPPPHPRTRYVELAVREYNDGRVSLVDDLRVHPVHVARNLSSSIPGFKPKRGILEISERIYTKTPLTEVQWIYSNDFHLYAIAHPDNTLDQMVDRIITKIDQIVTSLQCGIRVTSPAEEQKIRRDAFDAVIGKPKPVTPAPVRTAESTRRPHILEPEESKRRSAYDAVIAKPKPVTPAPVRTAESRRRPQIIVEPEAGDRRSMHKKILKDLDMFGITPASFRNTDQFIERIIIPKEADINKQVLARIEEILDDDWLYT